ncbi:NfuA family Fe-S biogenesis protein [Marinihelvus fidelis]|uniref:Fe/S biogenesis protein NfuA n=1 Tax=Marinihelvus fidelis TaxID=2613842 RepID=A0A5N0TBC6_9GAMM|nr:NfuA family Fe-S biogenesis protein [Marinihelvus fidelis]KAA9132051.1 NfuA family Fe-S biogenesis protein [Marinihelvus fidelis]
MIDISPAAQAYFLKLIDQQGGDGLALRLSVLAPGTPRAVCDLQFWPADRHNDNDRQLHFDGFEVHVEPSSAEWLEGAEIDFEVADAGGQLNIRAPGIKGNAPAEDAPLAERVQWVLEAEVNPGLAAHGGHVNLERVTPANELVLRFGGGCQGCGMVGVTLKQGIETTLKKHFPEITAILDATDHESGENPYYDRETGDQAAG